MHVTFSAQNTPIARDYLVIVFNGKEYKLDEFSKLEKQSAKRDELIKECKLTYRGHTMTYDEYIVDIQDFAKKLEISQCYSKLYSTQHKILDFDYNMAIKLVKTFEQYLQYGRLNLLSGHKILDYNCNIDWENGYVAVYVLRGIQVRNAILNYNNCMDIIMQIIFVAFGLYKVYPDFDGLINVDDIQKWCDYEYLSRIYSRNKELGDFKELWKTVSNAWKIILPIRDLANRLKHQQNIEFIGEYIVPPYSMKMRMTDGRFIDYSLFEPQLVDMDALIQKMMNIHCELVKIFHEILEFINFEKASIRTIENKDILPNEQDYKRIQISSTRIYPKKEISLFCLAFFKDRENILVRVDDRGTTNLPMWVCSHGESMEKTLIEKLLRDAGIICIGKRLKRILHIDQKRGNEKTLIFCYEISQFSIDQKHKISGADRYIIENITHVVADLSEDSRFYLDELGEDTCLEAYYLQNGTKISRR